LTIAEERNGGITYRSVAAPDHNDPGSGRLNRIYHEFPFYTSQLSFTKSWLEGSRPKPKTLTMLLYYIFFYGVYFSINFVYEAFYTAETGEYSIRLGTTLEDLSDGRAAIERKIQDYKDNRSSKLLLKNYEEPGVPHTGEYIVTADSAPDSLIESLLGKHWDRFGDAASSVHGTAAQQLVSAEYQNRSFSSNMNSVFRSWAATQVSVAPFLKAWWRDRQLLQEKELVQKEAVA
jgi:hypothetical protein